MLTTNSKRLVLAHFWVAFAAFFLALVLGEWQMFIRSPLSAWIGNPELYYRSVTAHGSAMGYVFPTLVAMGFGYAIVELALKQALIEPMDAVKKLRFWKTLVSVGVKEIEASFRLADGLRLRAQARR